MTRFQFPVRNLPLPIQEIATEVEHIVDRMFPKASCCDTAKDCCEQAFSPAMDVAETDSQYLVSLDLPGMKIEDVKIELHEDRLTVSGSRKPTERSDGIQFHREERSFGTFKRTLVLPKSVDTEKVDASYEAGVLTIAVPKLAKAQPRTIEIRTTTN